MRQLFDDEPRIFSTVPLSGVVAILSALILLSEVFCLFPLSPGSIFYLFQMIVAFMMVFYLAHGTRNKQLIPIIVYLTYIVLYVVFLVFAITLLFVSMLQSRGYQICPSIIPTISPYVSSTTIIYCTEWTHGEITIGIITCVLCFISLIICCIQLRFGFFLYRFLQLKRQSGRNFNVTYQNNRPSPHLSANISTMEEAGPLPPKPPVYTSVDPLSPQSLIDPPAYQPSTISNNIQLQTTQPITETETESILNTSSSISCLSPSLLLPPSSSTNPSTDILINRSFDDIGYLQTPAFKEIDLTAEHETITSPEEDHTLPVSSSTVFSSMSAFDTVPPPQRVTSLISPQPLPRHIPSETLNIFTTPADLYSTPSKSSSSELYSIPPVSQDHTLPSTSQLYSIPPEVSPIASLESLPVVVDIYSTPSGSHGPELDNIYSIPPKEKTSIASDLYSTPPTLEETAPELYSTPPTLEETASELYSTPPTLEETASELYSTPPTLEETASELYSTPPIMNNTISELYSTPPIEEQTASGLQINSPNGNDIHSDLYCTPPGDDLLKETGDLYEFPPQDESII